MVTAGGADDWHTKMNNHLGQKSHSGGFRHVLQCAKCNQPMVLPSCSLNSSSECEKLS